MDENIVLKYRREFDCWVCDECDIENANTQNTCVVCNAPRPPYPTILKAWSPADEAPVPATPPRRNPPPKPPVSKPRPPVTGSRTTMSSGPVIRDESRGKYPPPTPEKSGMSTALIWLLVLIVIFAVLIAVSSS